VVAGRTAEAGAVVAQVAAVVAQVAAANGQLVPADEIVPEPPRERVGDEREQHRVPVRARGRPAAVHRPHRRRRRPPPRRVDDRRLVESLRPLA
jgi:hypothetical protein